MKKCNFLFCPHFSPKNTISEGLRSSIEFVNKRTSSIESCLHGVMVEHCFCMRKVPRSNLMVPKTFFAFFLVFLKPKGSNLVKKWHFSAVFSGYGTSIKKFSIKFGLEWSRCPLAVSGGSWSNFKIEQLLFNKKIEKS